jgi:hypothetical protein
MSSFQRIGVLVPTDGGNFAVFERSHKWSLLWMTF